MLNHNLRRLLLTALQAAAVHSVCERLYDVGNTSNCMQACLFTSKGTRSSRLVIGRLDDKADLKAPPLLL